MFVTRVTANFPAVYTLKNYIGNCVQMLAYHCKAGFVMIADALDNIDILIGFRAIKNKTKLVIESLDYQSIKKIKL